MMKKKTPDEENPQTVNEPQAVYQTRADVDKWNPNAPVCATQEEWWEHIHEIERGEFTPLETANQEFDKWREIYLKSRLS